MFVPMESGQGDSAHSGHSVTRGQGSVRGSGASKCFSLELALIAMPTIHGARGSSAPPRPKGAGREIPGVGRIPVQPQEGHMWLC